MADALQILDKVSARVALVEKLMGYYNGQDADAYADMFTETGSEASYRGAVIREGREGVRAGLKKVFAEFPENRADVLQTYELGEYVVLHERVYRSTTAEPFDVLTVYSFAGDKVDRVEFVR